jgi:sulfur carrier protein ThiS
MNESGTLRRLSIALLVGLLVMTAGCSSLSGGGASPTDEATTAPTETPTATPTPTTTAASTDDGHSHGNESSEGHSHGNESSSNATAENAGKMAVVVAGERVDLSFEDRQAIRMDEDARDTYHVNGSVSLQRALSAAGVEANASALTYDGETYRDSANGTEVVYRVNGEPVAPNETDIEAGDEVWVLVVEDGGTVETPGDYIPPERLHVHGDIEFTVDGERVDFSRDKYQQAGHNDHFHFEGGHANPWHAHSAHVTLAYGLSTLEGINVTEDTVTYDNETYEYGSEGGAATVMVNGEPVDATDHYLKDGDSVRIVIESDE